MIDPAYRVAFVIILILLADYFLLDGTFLDIIGGILSHCVNWITGFLGG